VFPGGWYTYRTTKITGLEFFEFYNTTGRNVVVLLPWLLSAVQWLILAGGHARSRHVVERVPPDVCQYVPLPHDSTEMNMLTDISGKVSTIQPLQLILQFIIENRFRNWEK
jgi:hypothetical protein